jgi:superfamily I DNA and/or RNA helicase
MKEHFEIIILLGRPASGKSEVIDHLKRTPIPERLRRFHINRFEEIDDFPMLWTWFEEDAILEKIMHKPRVHSDADGYFLHQYQWDLLIERISLEYEKKLRNEGYAENMTTLIEFSRGTEHGGYESAFRHLSKDILEKACILYIDVPYEESLRKNRRRFNPSRPDSILEHGLPDGKLERLYKEVDWECFKGTNPKFIVCSGLKIPYAVFENMPEKTDKPDVLGAHLEDALNTLWSRRREVRP